MLAVYRSHRIHRIKDRTAVGGPGSAVLCVVGRATWRKIRRCRKPASPNRRRRFTHRRLLAPFMLTFESVAVVVRDEKKAMKFWKDKMGFRVVTRWPHWVTVAPRGSTVRLHLCPDSRPERGNTGYLF